MTQLETNSALKPVESKREMFKNYLSKSGVMDQLTRILVTIQQNQD